MARHPSINLEAGWTTFCIFVSLVHFFSTDTQNPGNFVADQKLLLYLGGYKPFQNAEYYQACPVSNVGWGLAIYFSSNYLEFLVFFFESGMSELRFW